MLITVQQILQQPVYGAHEALGDLVDLLLDSYTWNVRFGVVEVGAWLASRPVLIDAPRLAQAQWNETEHALRLPLSRSEIRACPPLESLTGARPPREAGLVEHFVWGSHWREHLTSQPAPVGVDAVPTPASPAEQRERDLYAARQLIGYRLEAVDGEVGALQDFLLDLDHWVVRYFIVELDTFLGGRRRLISPGAAEAIHPSDRLLRVHFSAAEIEAAPEYDPRHPLDPHAETSFPEPPKYWLW